MNYRLASCLALTLFCWMSAAPRHALAAAADVLPDDASIDTNELPKTPALADQRFSLMWLSGTTPHRAAIRGDASIRDTDDAGLVVTHVAAGQYCIQVTSANEGAVGVLQDQGGAHGTIDVSMGIGSFCNAVSGAQITVQTWQIP